MIPTGFAKLTFLQDPSISSEGNLLQTMDSTQNGLPKLRGRFTPEIPEKELPNGGYLLELNNGETWNVDLKIVGNRVFNLGFYEVNSQYFRE